MEDKNKNINDPEKVNSTRQTIEFNFEDDSEIKKDVNSLVFEAADTLKIIEGENALKNEATEDEAIEAKTEEIKEEQGEFSVPDEFVVNEKYNTPTVAEEQTRIWTTYLPRFTGASDNYRMKNDPRPRQTPVTEVKLDTDAPLRSSSKVDPTAETDADGGATPSVVVNVSGGDVEPEGESLSVFKFKTNDVEKIPRADAAPKAVEEPSAEETVVLESVEDTQPTVNAISIEEETEETVTAQSKSFDIPDPVNNDVHIVDYSARNSTQLQSYSFVPDGANEQPDVNEKREFVTHSRRDDFKDKFLDLIISSRVRIAVAALVALAILVFENIGLLGIDIIKTFNLDFIPGARVILDAQLCVCLYLLAIPEVIDSFKHLFKGKLLPSFMLTVQLVVILGYALLISLTKTINYPLFGFIYAVFVLTLLVCSYLKRSADFSAFKLVSKNEEKYILDKKDTLSLEHENHALDGAIDEYRSKIVRMFRTTFVSDFFKRTGAVSVNTLRSVITVFVTLGISVVVGLVCFFIPTEGMTNLASSASAFVLTYLLACPAFSVLSSFLSYYHCEKTAVSDNSAVLGDESFLGYSDVDVMTFHDVEIFTEEDVNLKRLMLYGDRENMTKAMRQMSSLFAAAGGPLDHVFSNSLDRKCQPATSLLVEEDGISGIAEGKHISAGTEEYMSRHGIFVPASSEKSAGADTTKVMYAAEDGQIYAKFDIRYSFSEEFTMILPTLKKEGIVPLIYTRDPNITNELVASITRDQRSVRVMKKLFSDDGEEAVYRRASSGIVTLGDKLDALNMLLLSKKYTAFKKKTAAMEYAAVAVGSVLAAVLSLVGVNLATVCIGAWQVVWCVAIGIMSRKKFLKSKKKKETDNV